jgi:hypothetical protein
MATHNTKLLRAYISGIWELANISLFNSRLPKPRFFFVNRPKADFAGYWGLCSDGQHRITINLAFGDSDLRELIVHEMIHQFQMIQKSARTQAEQHGRFFQRHHTRIFGYPYTGALTQ